MNLQWTSNENLSACHAAWCLAQFPEQTGHCAPQLQSAVAELVELVAELPVPSGRFWDQLLTLAANVYSSTDFANRLAIRLGISSETQKSRLAASLHGCRRHFALAYPQTMTEIPLRTGPVRMLWEAHGPGLLRLIAATIDEDVVENAEIVLVQPMVGGMGYAHLASNRIHLEALLTHASQRLPETLRIAWLLSQLDLDRPVYSELINAHRLPSVAGLGMLPVVLKAGQELDLCSFSPELLAEAVEIWHCDLLQLAPATVAAVLTTWWDTVEASRPSWRIALTGLDQMLV